MSLVLLLLWVVIGMPQHVQAIEKNWVISQAPGVKDIAEDRKNDEETQDDEVEKILYKLRVSSQCFFCQPNHQMIQKLNQNNFRQFVDNDYSTFVLFWQKFDTLSRVVFYLWGWTSKRLHHANSTGPRVMGAVACHDWIHICQNNNVYSWPRVLIYNNGKLVGEYDSVFDESIMASFIRLYEVDAPMNLPSMASVLAVQNSKLSTLSPVFNHVNISATTIGLFQDCNTAEAKVFSDIAQQLRGRYVLAMGCGQVFHSWIKSLNLSKSYIALIKTFRPNDVIRSESQLVLKSFGRPQDGEFIRNFVIDSSRPVLTPLNAYTLPSIVNSGRTPVVLIGSADKLIMSLQFQLIGNIAMKTSFKQQFSFTYLEWVESELPKAWGVEYADIPALVAIDMLQGKAHRITQLKQNQTDQIEDWLLKLIGGESQAFASLPNPTFGNTIMKHDHLGYLYGTPGLKEKEYYRSPSEEQTESEEINPVWKGEDGAELEEHSPDKLIVIDNDKSAFHNITKDDHVEL